jgi:hypothetical protein
MDNGSIAKVGNIANSTAKELQQKRFKDIINIAKPS